MVTMAMLLAAALIAATPASATGPASAMPLVLQAEHQDVNATLTTGGAQAFVYNPQELLGAARTAAVKTFGTAGSSSSRMAKQFPALSGYGIAQTYFELAPCANRAPHTHPFASGLLFAIDATALEVGFVLEDASKTVVNNMTTGASAVFPQGLLHYQQNRDCRRTAKFTISYNSDDPQTVNQAMAFFKLPTEVIAAAMNVTPAAAAGVAAFVPTVNIYPGAIAMDSSCAAACAAAGTPVVTDGATSGSGLPTSTAVRTSADMSAASQAALPTADAGGAVVALAAAASTLLLAAAL